MMRPAQLRSEFKRITAPAKPTSGSPRLTLRFTESEIEQLRMAAGAMTLSAYVRRQLFPNGTAHRRGSNRTPLADQQALARLLGLLGQSRIPESIARLAEESRSGALVVDEETTAAIRDACTFVRAMRDDLVAALGLRETRSR